MEILETKIDWKAKLGSRKFWAAIAGLAVSISVIVGADGDTTQTIAGLIGSIADIVVYIFAEAYVDKARANLVLLPPLPQEEIKTEVA